jgi:hypothetical protein
LQRGGRNFSTYRNVYPCGNCASSRIGYTRRKQRTQEDDEIEAGEHIPKFCESSHSDFVVSSSVDMFVGYPRRVITLPIFFRRMRAEVASVVVR